MSMAHQYPVFCRWRLILGLSALLIPSFAAAETARDNQALGENRSRDIRVERIVKLEPLPEAEVLIQSFEATILSDGSVTLSGVGRGRAGDPTTAIEFEVDLADNTYTTRRVDPQEIEPIVNGAQVLKDENSSPVAGDTREGRPESFEKVIRPGNWRGRVRVQTRDPIFVVLTETSATLTWTTFSNGTVRWNSRSDTCSAANPSSLGTHWFTRSCGPSPVFYTSTTRVCNEHRGSYYNWDFGFPSLRTDASQYIKICGRNDPYFDYAWTHTDSGEASLLIFGRLILN